METEETPAQGWEYPSTLPESYQGFSLQRENQWEGLIYRIFSYQDEEKRRSASVVYDKNTQEYMLRVKIGLTEFCDVHFIHDDLKAFEAILGLALLTRLETLRQCVPERMESLFRDKKILEWASEFEFPAQINGFEMFLSPQTCFQFTNGSYLILDYSDFTQDSSLRFYYNVFRDDFFAEYLVLGAPQATQRFDVKTIPELAALITRDLNDATLDLRSRIDAVKTLRSRTFARND
ncbi:MAG TPA: hypothetical protein VN631_16910 [Negativicutes bacterium]|nr:hypothetical protein [Negativicutes bacterium]